MLETQNNVNTSQKLTITLIFKGEHQSVYPVLAATSTTDMNLRVELHSE